MMKMYRVRYENGMCSPWDESLEKITARAIANNGIVEERIFNFLVF